MMTWRDPISDWSLLPLIKTCLGGFWTAQLALSVFASQMGVEMNLTCTEKALFVFLYLSGLLSRSRVNVKQRRLIASLSSFHDDNRAHDQVHEQNQYHTCPLQTICTLRAKVVALFFCGRCLRNNNMYVASLVFFFFVFFFFLGGGGLHKNSNALF